MGADMAKLSPGAALGTGRVVADNRGRVTRPTSRLGGRAREWEWEWRRRRRRTGARADGGSGRRAVSRPGASRTDRAGQRPQRRRQPAPPLGRGAGFGPDLGPDLGPNLGTGFGTSVGAGLGTGRAQRREAG